MNTFNIYVRCASNRLLGRLISPFECCLYINMKFTIQTFYKWRSAQYTLRALYNDTVVGLTDYTLNIWRDIKIEKSDYVKEKMSKT